MGIDRVRVSRWEIVKTPLSDEPAGAHRLIGGLIG